MKRQHSVSDSAFIIWHILLNLVTSFYFLPTTIGYARFAKSRTNIFLLNLFLGWTVIGYVVFLIWAIVDDKIEVQL